MYVLQNSKNEYIFEYLLGELLFCNSLANAMTFEDEFKAKDFRKRIYEDESVTVSVQRVIK